MNNNQKRYIEYVSMFMSVTRLIGDTHKRYWISEYSKLPIKKCIVYRKCTISTKPQKTS